MPLPPTASVAEQQGAYLVKCFNEHYTAFDPSDRAAALPLPGAVRPSAAPFSALFLIDYMFPKQPTFRYVERGAMASMGFGGGVLDNSKSELGPLPQMTGWAAFISWRGAYLSKQISWANMLLIPMYWFKAAIFGRDISRF